MRPRRPAWYAPHAASRSDHSLQVDRFDARLLLHEVPPRPSAPCPPSPSDDLNTLRYADLYASQPPLPQEDVPADTEAAYFEYVYPDETHDEAREDAPSAPVPSVDDVPFVPRFLVPDSFRDALPATRKQHKVRCVRTACFKDCTRCWQIIQETANFVRNAGGQMEVVLRVRQGSTPQFSFLMPHDRLHAYYRWVLDTDPQV